jgi:hypothetical protein
MYAVAGPDSSTPSQAFTTGDIEGSGSALPPPPVPAGGTIGDVSAQLGELTGLMRDLVATMREQSNVAKEQLVLARKAEQRFEEQRQAQRDDFQRWLNEHGLVKSRTKPAEETARAVLGRAISELVDYVEENRENLAEGTEFVRAEMSDKFGGLLHHLSVIYGTLKHLSAADQTAPGTKPPGT